MLTSESRQLAFPGLAEMIYLNTAAEGIPRWQSAGRWHSTFGTNNSAWTGMICTFRSGIRWAGCLG